MLGSLPEARSTPFKKTADRMGTLWFRALDLETSVANWYSLYLKQQRMPHACSLSDEPLLTSSCCLNAYNSATHLIRGPNYYAIH